MDANGRVGEITSVHVGPVEGVAEDFGGSCLRGFVAEHGLCLPATFSGGGPTWASSSGRRHRLD